jgi:hypothetical protein
MFKMKIKKNPSTPTRQDSPYHRVDALLHTMRRITQYEDALCELSHELKKSRVLSQEIRGELRDLLERIPSHDFIMDLESLKETLPASVPPTNSEKLAMSGCSSSIAKKKPGGKLSK